ncbi:MAG: ThiF family adenylyltransferase, partial [Bacteriovoracaceae bacterium]|nr:ThiF family adenylyltransferase [Bacteriovoracaceae bacterium]
VIDCCDNFATKYLLHDAAWFLKKDLVQASIYQYEGQVQVFNYSKNSEHGCLRCLWPQVPEKNCTGTCEQAGVIGATAGVMGSIQAMEAIKMTLGQGSTQQNTTTLVDLMSFNTSKIKWKKDEECPLCSSVASIKSVLNVDYESKKEFEVEGLNHPDMEIIDIREGEELSTVQSHNTYLSKPLSLLEEWKSDLVEDKKYLFVCSKGLRSSRLVESLRAENLPNCYSLFGGLEANL